MRLPHRLRHDGHDLLVRRVVDEEHPLTRNDAEGQLDQPVRRDGEADVRKVASAEHHREF